MPDNITCPGCQRRLRLPESLSNPTVVCPVCRKEFQAGAIPVAAAPVVLPPAIPMARVEEVPLRPEWDKPGSRSSAPAGPNPWANLDHADGSKRKKPATGWRRPEVKLLIGVLLFATAGIVVSGWRPWPQRPPVKIASPDDPDARGEFVLAAADPLPPDQLAAEVQAFLLDLGEAYRAQDHARIVRHFDASRMLDELLALGIFPPEFVRDRPTVLRILGDLPGRSLERQAQIFEWADFEIRSVKALDNFDAVVIARHTTDNGTAIRKVRWWLSRRSGAWKVYDMENLDIGMRFSILAGSSGGLGPLQEPTLATMMLRDALDAVATHNPALAEAKLKLLVRFPLPPALEPDRLMAWGVIHYQRRNYKEALQQFDAVALQLADMPVLDLYRGMTHNALGQWELARKHLQAYRDLLGDDALVCSQLGLALRGVRQWKSAAESYRRALDLNPQDADTFQGLLNSLERGAQHDDLAARFVKIENPRGHFEEFAADCKDRQDGESLEQLALAMKQLDPASPAVDYYLALALVWRGQSEKATAPLRSALAKEKNQITLSDFLRAYLNAMVSVGKLAEGYAAAPDPSRAFAVLAPELKRMYRQEELRELVALHAKNHADDSLLPFYRAEILVSEGQYQRAEKEFAAGLMKPPDDALLVQFRESRVAARYYTGQAVAAYLEIEPRHDTFDQLAELCLEDGNYPLLQTLLDLHAKNAPNTFEVLRTRARLKVRQKQIADGIAAFKAAVAKVVPKDQREAFIGDFLRDMVEVGEPLQAYEAAPNPVTTFSILARQLLDRGKFTELKSLIEAHRKPFPADNWLLFYTGQLHMEEKAWDRAAKAFGEAFNDDPDEDRFRSNYVYAMYRSGQGLTAYRQAGENTRRTTYYQLVNLLVHDKKAADLESLLDLRAQERDVHQPELLLNLARAKVFAKKPEEAIPLIRRACEMNLGDVGSRHYVWTFVIDMYEAGLPLEGYRAAPDKFTAFEALARRFVIDKKAAELEKLLAEHAPGRADDPYVCLYKGELYLLRNEPARAEPEFVAAMANRPQEPNLWLFMNSLKRARIQAGKVVVAYQEAGANARAFLDLANLCQREKNPRQLEALIAAHRRTHPDDPNLLTYDLELLWLRQDYEGVLKMLAEHGDDFASPRYAWKAADCKVRSLIKLKKTREAIEQAEAQLKNRRGNVALLVLAHAADGDVKQTIAALEREMTHRYILSTCYHDDDLGPILRSDAFREFRQRFPEPDTRRPGDDDDD